MKKAKDNGSHMSPSAGEEGSLILLFCSLPKFNTDISLGHIGKTRACQKDVKDKKEDIKKCVSYKNEVK